MLSTRLKAKVDDILSLAGVRIDGTRPWDIAVHNQDLYARVLRHGSLGLGETYMDGWWDSHDLDQFFFKVFTAGIDRCATRGWPAVRRFFGSVIFNPQTESRSATAVERHYDLGNELFQNMLDRRMVYTCGYWETAANLNEAQEAKLDFVCRKLELARGMKVLDIGCGWGSFAKFAAENYGVHVLGITLSPQQLELGRKLCAGLPVRLLLQDYREFNGSFDRIVSLGMFEHVGRKNYRFFFDVAHRCLREGGLLYLETIGDNDSCFGTDPWINRYIFPDSHLPSMAQIGEAIDGRFVMEELWNWATDYDRTLMAWFHNFDFNWGILRARYGERFYRMWKYYLLLSAGEFRAQRLQVWQILLAPVGKAGNAVTPKPLRENEHGRSEMPVSPESPSLPVGAIHSDNVVSQERPGIPVGRVRA